MVSTGVACQIFGVFNQLVFCVVLSQVSEGQSASHIHPVDRNMESFDLCLRTACLGKVSDQAYRDFVFLPWSLAAENGSSRIGCG
jgi:hypothetical protein